MIFAPPSDDMGNWLERRFRGEANDATSVDEIVAIENQPATELSDFNLTGVGFEQAEIQPGAVELIAEFDWSDKRTNREFANLEQRVLAGIASIDEKDQYGAMKSERDSAIFSNRYVSDYAEIQRLKILAEKISEIQKYLRPIKLG